MSNFSVIYYSNNQGNKSLLRTCLLNLRSQVALADGELITVTMEKLSEPSDRSIIVPEGFGHASIYRQILLGLAAAKSDVVFMAEHDVLYPIGYFQDGARHVRMNPSCLCYNKNVLHLTSKGYFPVCGYAKLLSNLSGTVDVVREGILGKCRELEFSGRVGWSEPGMDDDREVHEWQSCNPALDIRHGGNLTGDREPEDGIYSNFASYWGIAGNLCLGL